MQKIYLFLITITLLFTNLNLVNANENEIKSTILGCHNSITKEIRETVNGNCFLGGKYYNKWTNVTLEKWQLDIIMSDENLTIQDKLSLMGIKSNECSDPDGLCVRNNSDYGFFQINFIHEWDKNKSQYYISLMESKREGLYMKDYVNKYRYSKRLTFFNGCLNGDDYSKCHEYYSVDKRRTFEEYRKDFFVYQMYWTINRFKNIEKRHSCSLDRESYVKCQLWYHNGNMQKTNSGIRVADFYSNKGLQVINHILKKYDLSHYNKYIYGYSNDKGLNLIQNYTIKGKLEEISNHINKNKTIDRLLDSYIIKNIKFIDIIYINKYEKT